MLKLFEELGGMQIQEVTPIVQYMRDLYASSTNPDYSKLGKIDQLLATLQSIPQVYVNSLPIQCKLYPNDPWIDLSTLSEVMEDYYEIHDSIISRLKRKMYSARYVLQCIEEVRS